MNRNRIVFFLDLLLFILLFLFFDKWYFLIVAVIEVIMLIVFRLTLGWDCAKMEFTITLQKGCRQGSAYPLTLHMKKRFPLLSVNTVVVEVSLRNKMIDKKDFLQYRLVTKGTERHWKLPLDTEVCGEVLIEKIAVYGYDVFGICKGKIAEYKDQSFLIYPRLLRSQVVCGNSMTGNMEEEKESLPQKGKDFTEVYDLRDYAPGDSMHAIHWKLSGKMDKLIVKEPGDTLRTTIMIIMDIDKNCYEQSKELFSAAVALGRRCCQSLTEQNLSYVAGCPSKDKLNWKMVTDKEEALSFLEMWLCVEAPEKNGSFFKMISDYQQIHQFTQIIYLTAGEFPEELYTISEEAAIKAICLDEQPRKMQTAKMGNLELIKLSAMELQKRNNYIRL